MNLLGIGFSNLINADKIVAIVSPEALPVKKMIAESRARGSLIDASCGRKTKSVIVMESGHVVLSSVDMENLKEKE